MVSTEHDAEMQLVVGPLVVNEKQVFTNGRELDSLHVQCLIKAEEFRGVHNWVV